MSKVESPIPSSDSAATASRVGRIGTEWRGLWRFYLGVAAFTGVPCVALAVYVRDISVFFAWLAWLAMLPIALGAIVALWAVTAYPFALLLAALFGGKNGSAATGDPDGPGVVV